MRTLSSMSVFIALMTLRDCGRSRAVLQVELLALRHQLHVLEQSHGQRLRLSGFDPLLWAWLSQIRSGWRQATSSSNLTPSSPDNCARVHATEGEIVESLQQVFGTYTETPVF